MQKWINLFEEDNQPLFSDISSYIQNPLWEKINTFLQQGYQIQPALSYSRCSGQPGWNVKYQKAGRSLCTLYPMKGFFIALVVIGAKEQTEAELRLAAYTDYTRQLWQNTPFVLGGRWLMMKITDENILKDTIDLIQLRRKIKQAV